MQELEESLRLLGYDQRWLTYGFLTPDVLTRQCAERDSSGDENAEHYRYATFRSFLGGRSSISESDVSRYIELAKLDPDQTMAQSALAELLACPGLSADQFERLSAHRDFEADSLQRIAHRRRLISEISNGPISNTLAASCIAGKDSVVQRALVAACDVTREHLEMLLRDGCNRSVRNLARQRLRRNA
jgi:hypothetical protein